jgi:RNA polymerase sigma factor (sigma-70 family)
MVRRQSTPLLESIQHLFDEGTLSGAGESQLLDRFLGQGDEWAFEAIVRRHGPMVLGVCRRVLSDPNDVDDAFQATFLVLVKKAGSIRDRTVLGTWLHGVARRVAVRARVTSRKRQARERTGVETAACPDQGTGRESLAELRAIIDQELQRLPERYRSALVLCDLEGHTHEQVAATLGCPVGTVKSRLSRARDQLRERLVRRGVTASSATLAMVLAPEPAPTITSELLAATVGAASRLAAGRTIAAATVSAAVAALVQHTSRGLSMNALKFVVILTAGLVVTSAGTFAYQAQEKNAPQPVPAQAPDVKNLAAPGPKNTSEAQLDYGKAKSKPSDANVNPGPGEDRSVGSLAQARYKIAAKALEEMRREYRSNPKQAILEDLHTWALHAMEAERDLNDSHANRIAALKNYLDVWKEAEKIAEPNKQFVSPELAAYYRIEAELWLAQANAGTKPTDAASSNDGQRRPAGGKLVRPGTDPRSQALLAKLEEPIAMNFANPTPLADVIRYIQQVTADPGGSGIQIYVDATMLGFFNEDKGAAKTYEELMKTPIVMNLENVPLRRVLKLIAEQIGMGYGIKDGMVTMRPPDMRNRNWQELMVMEESFPESSPLAQEVDRARRGELTEGELAELEAKLQTIDEVTKRYRSIRMMGAGAGGMMMGRMPGAGPGGMMQGPAQPNAGARPQPQ